MSDLSCASEIIEFPDKTEILRFSFAGQYPPGSKGHATSVAIFDYILQVRDRYSPTALILDFTELDYVWGDDIGGMLMAIKRQDRLQNVSCPTCLVASGQTAQSLDNLFTTCGLKRIINTEIVATVEEATKYLRSE